MESTKGKVITFDNVNNIDIIEKMGNSTQISLCADAQKEKRLLLISKKN